MLFSRLPIIDAKQVLHELSPEKCSDNDEDCDDDDLEVEGLIPVLKQRPETNSTAQSFPSAEILNALHEDQRESFNGNFNHHGEFKEWYEVVSKTTISDSLLYILPYCVIE